MWVSEDLFPLNSYTEHYTLIIICKCEALKWDTVIHFLHKSTLSDHTLRKHNILNSQMSATSLKHSLLWLAHVWKTRLIAVVLQQFFISVGKWNAWIQFAVQLLSLCAKYPSVQEVCKKQPWNHISLLNKIVKFCSFAMKHNFSSRFIEYRM